MKNFYEMLRILENATGQASAEEKRRHFGIQGTGGGRTDTSVIYNDLVVNYDDHQGEIIVWFDDEKDLESVFSDANDIVGTSHNAGGYADVHGGPWNFEYMFTIQLYEDPKTKYTPTNLPAKHGPGIVSIVVTDIYTDGPSKTYPGPIQMRGNMYY